MGPVACPIRVDVVPRRAVRRVGPRPDLTRSTHIGEPCGPARLLGDGSRSSRLPYRAAHQPTGGDGKKNGGRKPPAPGSWCAEPPGGLSCRPGGFVFFPTNPLLTFQRITTGFGLRRRMPALLREPAADVVHLQDALAPTLGLVASSAAWRMGLPVVGTFHTWFRRSPGYWAFRRLLQPRLDRLAARIAVSRPVVQAMGKYFRAEFEIIPNGVPVGYFHPNGRRPDDAL